MDFAGNFLSITVNPIRITVKIAKILNSTNEPEDITPNSPPIHTNPKTIGIIYLIATIHHLPIFKVLLFLLSDGMILPASNIHANSIHSHITPISRAI